MKIKKLLEKYSMSEAMLPSQFGRNCETIFRKGTLKDWVTAVNMLHGICEKEPYNTEFYIDAFCAAYEEAKRR